MSQASVPRNFPDTYYKFFKALILELEEIKQRSGHCRISMAYTNVVERLKLQKVDHSKTKQLFFGNFLTHPTPSTMEIKIGAVLVSGADGHGVIEKVDWTVTSLEEAREKFTTGVDKLVTGEGELKVYENRKGWFAAGFIGKSLRCLVPVEWKYSAT